MWLYSNLEKDQTLPQRERGNQASLSKASANWHLTPPQLQRTLRRQQQTIGCNPRYLLEAGVGSLEFGKHQSSKSIEASVPGNNPEYDCDRGDVVDWLAQPIDHGLGHYSVAIISRTKVTHTWVEQNRRRRDQGDHWLPHVSDQATA